MRANDPILGRLKMSERRTGRLGRTIAATPDYMARIRTGKPSASRISDVRRTRFESTSTSRAIRSIFLHSQTEMKVRFSAATILSHSTRCASDAPRMLDSSRTARLDGPSNGRPHRNHRRQGLSEERQKGRALDDATLKSLGSLSRSNTEERSTSYADPRADHRCGGQSLAMEAEPRWSRANFATRRAATSSKNAAWRIQPATLRSVNLFYSFKEPLPPKAEIRLRVQKNARKIRVPFAFKDIAVPPMPKE